MWSRRNLLHSSVCCAAHCVTSRSVYAQGAPTAFVCSTVEPHPDPFALPGPAPIEFNGGNSLKINITPFGTAFLSSRWLRDDGQEPGADIIKLGVAFLNGNTTQQATVKAAADNWNKTSISKYIVFVFDVDLLKADLRVHFDPGDGNWSYVGRGAKQIKQQQKTIAIADVDLLVCEHELGHALCLQHELQFPGDEIRWNEVVVIEFMKSLGWSEKTTRSQILSKLPANAVCIGDPKPNFQSVMTYWTLPGWAEYKDHADGTWKPLVVQGKQHITDRDANCVAGIYSYKGHS